MDLSTYSKLIKLLTLIPLLIGTLTFTEIILPNNIVKTVVKSKNESYRVKTNKTTYTIEFENLNDQFTPEIYNKLNEGDSLLIEVSPIHRQIISITILNDNERLMNDTGENYAIMGFGLVFIISSLVWFKKGKLSKKQSLYVSFIILLSMISGIRML